MDDLPSLEIFLLVVSLGLSGLFSSSETALTALSEAKARQLLDEQKRGSRALKLWLDRPNRVLTAILIGNNIVNTFIAALTTVLVARVFGDGPAAGKAVAAATGLVTIAILVVGEITPKTFAKHNADRIAPWLMLILEPWYYVALPVVVAFSQLSVFLVRLTGGRASRTGPFVTEEDIAYMIRLGHEEGVLEPGEGEMLESVMDFNDTMVREIMIPRTEITALPLGASHDDVYDAVRENFHSRMPVYDDSIDQVVGFFYAKDLIRWQSQDGGDFALTECLRKPLFIPEVMKLDEVLKLFQRKKTHLAVVVDEYGGTAGIVTMEDVLEELVGEIHDEYDTDEEELREIRRIDANHFIALGKANVDEVGETIGVEFPEGATYETIGGFLTAHFGKVPLVADAVVHQGWRIVVQDADERRVLTVLLERVSFETDLPHEPEQPHPELRVVHG